MATYGLTTDGLIVKTLSVIRDELTVRMRDAFGASISLGDRSILGQLEGIVAEVAALVWELAEAINASQDPDKATGAGLDALCLITGTLRPAASYSTVVLTLTGSPTTVVSSGSTVRTASTDIAFQTIEDGTIASVSAWVGTTAYSVDDRVTNGGNVYQCTIAGTSAGSGGPTTTGTAITDGGVTWLYLGAGTGAVDVNAQGSTTGPLTAIAYDLTVIDSLTSGWDGVINLLDATPGRDQATDAELRQLREAELATAGNSPIDAIRADLLAVPDVKAVTVFVNNTDVTNSDGMPPHSVECMILGPDSPTSDFDQSIFDMLLASVAAGIQTYGGGVVVSGTATDSQGVDHDMMFSRPTNVPIYAYLNITYDNKEYPADGDTLIKEAIVDFGDAQATGKDAVVSSIIAKAFSVDGVLAVNYAALSDAAISTPVAWAATTAYVTGNCVLSSGRVYRCTVSGTSGSTGPSASGTGIVDGSVTWAHLGETIAISLRELATWDTSRISVTSVAGTP